MNSFDMYYSGKKINFKKLINYIIDWLDDNMDNPEAPEPLRSDSADLNEKIKLYLEGENEFE